MQSERPRPYWYFIEATLSAGHISFPPQIFAREIKSGYDYIVEGFLISWDASSLAPLDVSSPPLLTFIQTERGRMITQIPIDTTLVTTPGANKATGANQQYIAFRHFNYVLSTRDVLQLQLQARPGGDPVHAQVLVTGLLVRHEE